MSGMSNYMSAAGGNYYATGTRVREDGKRFGVDVARQRKSLREACRALEESGLRGYVQRWDESTQRRYIVAERDEAGNWWTTSPYDGTVRALDPFEKVAR